MEKSTSIQKLMIALGGLQAECIKVKKDSTNPHFKSKYASLSVILDEIQPILTKYKLAYTQLPEGGKLTTLLMHTESGEYIQTDYDLNAVQSTPQAIGSAITYARRYCLTSTLGLNIDDDDDGNAATEPKKTPPPPPAQTASPNTAPAATAANTAPPPSAKSALEISGEIDNAKTKQELIAIYNANAAVITSSEQLRAHMKKKEQQILNGGKAIITDAQLKKVIERINGGELEVYTNALNTYVLIDSQKSALEMAYAKVSAVNKAIAQRGYTDPVIISQILGDCTSTDQVMKLHQNNNLIIDRDPKLLALLNEKLRQLKKAA